MVEYKNHNDLDAIFQCLADATRRDMLRQVAGRTRTVGELAKRYEITFAGTSKHVGVLMRAGLVRKRRKGREIEVEISPKGLKRADAYIEQYRAVWEERFDRLEAFIAKNK